MCRWLVLLGLFGVGLGAGLTACGQKGPLVLPSDVPQSEKETQATPAQQVQAPENAP